MQGAMVMDRTGSFMCSSKHRHGMTRITVLPRDQIPLSCIEVRIYSLRMIS